MTEYKKIFKDDGNTADCCERCLPIYWPEEEIGSKCDGLEGKILAEFISRKINCVYNGCSLQQHIDKGRTMLQKIYSESSEGSLIARDTVEVADVVWFVLFMVARKQILFVSGSIIVEDEGFKLFKWLAHLSYTREMSVAKALFGKVSSDPSWYFGSTHFIGLLKLCQNTPSLQAHLIDKHARVEIKNGEHITGYQQLGIDFKKKKDGGDLKVAFFAKKCMLLQNTFFLFAKL